MLDGALADPLPPPAGRNGSMDRGDYVGEPHVRDLRWLDLCRHPGVLDAIESILGPNLILVYSSVFIKPPASPLKVGWHQDNTCWPSVHGTAVITLWLAVDDADTDNSAMKVIPGSHRGWKELETVDSGADQMLHKSVPVSKEQEESAVALEMSAGSLSIHDSFILHGSDENRSGRRRAGYTIRYCSTDTAWVDLDIHPHPVFLVRGAGRLQGRPLHLPASRRGGGHGAAAETVSADAASLIPINYDEEAVPEHELPDPLHFEDGSPVGAAAWPRRRREILRLFEDHVYGGIPRPPSEPRNCHSCRGSRGGRPRGLGDPPADLADLEDRPPRLQGRFSAVPAGLTLATGAGVRRSQLLRQPDPAHCDPAILLTDSWVRNSDSPGIEDNRANDRTRGTLAHRWQVELILSRGYGLATAYCGDFDPDFDDGYRNGVHPLYSLDGQTGPAPGDWGTIGAWAWGLCRVCDYLETDADVDASRVA